MKTYKHLWEKLITKENFELAYINSIKKKRKQRGIREFNKDKENNLEAVRQLVISGKFHTSPYREKEIYEPKRRTIYKLPYSPDRIVQHAIMNVLKPIFINLMIENTYACVEEKGPLKAGQKCAEYVRKYDYCLKCDIRKFYPSIDQKILSDKLHRIIKDNKFMEIVDDVVFSFPGGKNCPIGNYMSQWLGNFYLTSMDNYILHTLKPDGYERYCDDFILFSNNKTELNHWKSCIRTFLNTNLLLDYSKAEVFNVKQGVDYCGYRYFKGYVLIRKNTSKRIKRRFKEIDTKLKTKTANIEKAEGQIASANGVMKHACSHNFRVSISYEELKEKVNKEKEQ